jgi:ABC-type glutathione transport system ATPase component
VCQDVKLPRGPKRSIFEAYPPVCATVSYVSHRVGLVIEEQYGSIDNAQVLLLLQDLQRELGLTYILISHSLPVVAQMATHIAVMRAGQFVEFGPTSLVLEHPEGVYTKELLAAVPEIPRTGQL